MSMKYMLDTHTWVWWNMRPQNLSRKVTKLIENTEGYDELLLSAISPWEFSKLLDKSEFWHFQSGIDPFLRVVGNTNLPFFQKVDWSKVLKTGPNHFSC